MNEEPNNSTNMSEEDITPMTIVSTMVRPSGKYSLNEGDMLGSYRIRKPLYQKFADRTIDNNATVTDAVNDILKGRQVK